MRFHRGNGRCATPSTLASRPLIYPPALHAPGRAGSLPHVLSHPLKPARAPLPSSSLSLCPPAHALPDRSSIGRLVETLQLLIPLQPFTHSTLPLSVLGHPHESCVKRWL